VDEQGCEKKHKRWSEELTSGTVKLMAILKKMTEGFGVGEEGTSLEILELSNIAAAGKVELELWNDVMGKEYPRRNYL